MSSAPCSMGHRQVPASLGVPTCRVITQTGRAGGKPPPHACSTRQNVCSRIWLLTGLNSTSKLEDVPAPAASASQLLHSGCPQWEALEGKPRHTKAMWCRQFGSRIIQGYNNYSSSGICHRFECLEINTDSLSASHKGPSATPAYPCDSELLSVCPSQKSVLNRDTEGQTTLTHRKGNHGQGWCTSEQGGCVSALT